MQPAAPRVGEQRLEQLARAVGAVVADDRVERLEPLRGLTGVAVYLRLSVRECHAGLLAVVNVKGPSATLFHRGLHPGDRHRQGARLFALHTPGVPLRLLNAWDAGSARLFEARGAQVIGTTSAGVAFALGRPDGALGRDEMLEATARIAAAVAVPLSADIESGFGATPAAVGETVAGVLAAGAVGINLEDSATDGDEPLLPVAEMAARVSAARASAEREGVRLFVNARTDVYWLPARRRVLAARSHDRAARRLCGGGRRRRLRAGRHGARGDRAARS